MNVLDTIALAIVGFAGLLHLNRMHGRGWIECFGFALIVAGALGRGCEFWWAGIASGMNAEHFLYAGLAILSVKVAGSDIQRMLNYDRAVQNIPLPPPEAKVMDIGDAFIGQRFNRHG